MWNQTRYRQFCVRIYERGSVNKFNIQMGTTLHSLAQKEIDRDWTLKTFIEEHIEPGRAPTSRFVEDIQRHGELARISATL